MAMKNALKSKVLGSLAAAALMMAWSGAPALAQESKPVEPTKDKAPAHDKDKEKAKDKGKDKTKDGAKQKGTPVHVGDSAPDFTGKDLDGKEHKLSDLTKAGKTVVLVWFNPDCPFVEKHFKDGHNTFKTMADAFKDKEVVVLAINSSAKGKQGFGSERNTKARKDWSITFPIIMDEEGTIGKAYGAKQTPATYVISKTGSLAYIGAIDDNREAKAPGKTNYAIKAVEELLAGKPVTLAETTPYGCGVKYAN
jgi:peroxiredoxin